jgi:CheY-like chemotaxis protein
MERAEQECHRILVVDDDQPILDFLRSLLQPLSIMAPLLSVYGKADAGGVPGLPYDFEVVTLLQGEDAVAEVARSEEQQRPFSVALIDMHMPPGINGLETARQLLQISPEIEIVFLTAYTEYIGDLGRHVYWLFSGRGTGLAGCVASAHADCSPRNGRPPSALFGAGKRPSRTCGAGR